MSEAENNEGGQYIDSGASSAMLPEVSGEEDKAEEREVDSAGKSTGEVGEREELSTEGTGSGELELGSPSEAKAKAMVVDNDQVPEEKSPPEIAKKRDDPKGALIREKGDGNLINPEGNSPGELEDDQKETIKQSKEARSAFRNLYSDKDAATQDFFWRDLNSIVGGLVGAQPDLPDVRLPKVGRKFYRARCADYRLLGLSLGVPPSQIRICDLRRDQRGEEIGSTPNLPGGLQAIIDSSQREGAPVLIIHVGQVIRADIEVSMLDLDSVVIPETVTAVILVSSDPGIDLLTARKPIDVLDFEEVPALIAASNGTGAIEDPGCLNEYRESLNALMNSQSDLDEISNQIKSFVQTLIDSPDSYIDEVQQFISATDVQPVDETWKAFLKETATTEHAARCSALFLLSRFGEMSMLSFEKLFEDIVGALSTGVAERDAVESVLSNDVYSRCGIRTYTNRAGQRVVRLGKAKSWSKFIQRSIEYEMPAIFRKLELALIANIGKHLSKRDILDGLVATLSKRMSDDNAFGDDMRVTQQLVDILFSADVSPSAYKSKIAFLQAFFSNVARNDQDSSGGGGQKDASRRLFRWLLPITEHKSVHREAWRLIWGVALSNPTDHLTGLIPDLVRAARKSPVETLFVLGNTEAESSLMISPERFPLFLIAIAEVASDERGGKAFNHALDWHLFDLMLRNWLRLSLEMNAKETDPSRLLASPLALKEPLRRHLTTFAKISYAQVGETKTYGRLLAIGKSGNFAEPDKYAIVMLRRRFLEGWNLFFETKCDEAQFSIVPFALFQLNLRDWRPLFVEDEVFNRSRVRSGVLHSFDRHIDTLSEFPALLALMLCHERNREIQEFLPDEKVQESLEEKLSGGERISARLRECIMLLRDDLLWAMEWYSGPHMDPAKIKADKQHAKQMRSWLGQFMKVLRKPVQL